MKERPILFSGPMVRAILAGRKTMTRRIVKPQPPDWVCGHVNRSSTQDLFQWTEAEQKPLRKLRRWPEWHYMRCPFGFPVKRLWVRETWAKVYVYQAGREWVVYREEDNRTDYGGPWKPSIFMPRWASRILLEVVNVRVERLQDISEDDAMKEGIDKSTLWNGPDGKPSAGQCLRNSFPSAKHAFSVLWESINGKCSWSANPWVWVVEFKRVQP